MVESMAVQILHVDQEIVVVNKPAGLPVLPDGWQQDSTYLVSLLEVEYGRIWIVHRLDKVTSGVLVAARTAEAHRSLSIQFEQHQAHKVYHAIVSGVPEWDERTAGQSLRSNVGHRHRTIIDARRGKPSRTVFRVLERLRDHTLVEARPLTGRTHQIRVHAAAMHCPLRGDSLYGASPAGVIHRPALHALSLSFTHPRIGQPVTYTAPYPGDFAKALEALRLGAP
jgi:RluA family pseudouridine synthase